MSFSLEVPPFYFALSLLQLGPSRDLSERQAPHLQPAELERLWQLAAKAAGGYLCPLDGPGSTAPAFKPGVSAEDVGEAVNVNSRRGTLLLTCLGNQTFRMLVFS